MKHHYRRKCIERKGEKCRICGEKEDVDVHHVDGNRRNNSLTNLVPICRYCHVGIHQDRENYSHWHEKLLPWYNNGKQETDVGLTNENQNAPTRRLADDLIFLERLVSSIAINLARLENGNKPFQCPQCAAEQTLASEYSLNNHKPCPECDWFGRVSEGVIEAVCQKSDPAVTHSA